MWSLKTAFYVIIIINLTINNNIIVTQRFTEYAVYYTNIIRAYKYYYTYYERSILMCILFARVIFKFMS